MSHLSKLKTKIVDTNKLVKVLSDLAIEYELQYNRYEQKPAITLKSVDKLYQESKTRFIWDGANYELIADSASWQEKYLTKHLVDKICQKYAYRTVLEESFKQGFEHTNTHSRSDGSIRLVLERWQQ
uniref:Uncharacterized protein ycf35 n=1 Tax=Liagoropsis maxima TaxID=1653392 RepID=A0A1G4NVP2_9FLOR|nr:Hypothetical protein ycf35 [Liagoropsis maxima]SCW22684.1 Hypothetical protein ycf35 [Liagoropsis maxima]